jgi:hypothetical protein
MVFFDAGILIGVHIIPKHGKTESSSNQNHHRIDDHIAPKVP